MLMNDSANEGIGTKKKTFHLRLAQEEYDQIEELQTIVNRNTGNQYTKSDILKLSVDVYLRILKICEADQ